MKNQLHILLLSVMLFSFLAHAQQITTAVGTTPDQLVQQSLGNDCVQIANVRSTINGNVDGIASFGSFSRASSAFPFVSGFLLTTGNAVSAGNGFIGPDLNDGSIAWTGDADLEAGLGITNTLNATAIEFDLISVTNQISFNYLLASEEYQLDFPCNVSDGFALLIRPTGSNVPYQNIAIIPGTSTPVGINTIHPEVVGQCPAENASFFEGTNIGHTNYMGLTLPFTATAAVVPNVSYHVKLVVADQVDFRADTAVFIESGSLTAAVDLGPDQNPCDNTTLNAEVGNPLAQYSWYRNGQPVPSQTGSTLVVTSSGAYSVEVLIPSGATSCVISDDVVVTINPDQLTLNLNDLVICDDASNDGLEAFNLGAARTAIRSSLALGNYTINFYESIASATALVNEFPDLYTNLINGQTVYVRVNNADSGCYGITALRLQVNAQPTATAATYEQCDLNTDGFTLIDLSALGSLVSTTTTATRTTYHSTAERAISNTAALGSSFINTSNPQTIFTRVTDLATGCFVTSTLGITINIPPTLNETRAYIDACDQDYDGFATFDLTAVENEFTAGLGNVTTTYHFTAQQAASDTNPIATPASFANTTARIQNVFIRVIGLNGCASVGTITLYTNYLLDATVITNAQACDDSSNDGFASFDLTQIALALLNNTTDIAVFFYLSEADQLANTNNLEESVPFINSVNPQTIWLRLESANCIEFATILFTVAPYFASQPIPNQTYCDDNQDQRTTVPLSIFNDAVRAPFTTDYSVRYYRTEQHAQSGTNAITTFTNTTPTFVIWAQTINPAGCADQQPLTITVLPAPLAAAPAAIFICDDDGDGFYITDITAQQTVINAESNRSVSYHNSLANANSGANPIGNATTYNARTEIIYVRVVNNSTGCHSVASLPIQVNTLPVFTQIETYNLCESDGDGFEPFLLNTKTAAILNGQPSKVVSYHATALQAINRTNPINPNAGYINLSSPQTIYVRVENMTDTSCFGTSSFQIEVNETPRYNMPTALEVCDESNSNNTVATFNLQTTIDQIVNGIGSNLTVAFYSNMNDANAQRQSLPLQYTNRTNPETIIARIGNDQLCYELEQVTLNVIAAPLVNTATPSVTCDDNYDGLGFFDLRFRESEIVGTRPFNAIITWHTALADANEGINSITNASSFANTTNPQTVYLRIFNTVSGCYTTAPLELQVTTPPVVTRFAEYTICNNPANEANLNLINTSFISPFPATATITYYTSASDAQNEINALPVPYRYSSETTLLYARIADNNTGCFYVTSFTLVIQAPPILPAAGSYDLEFCDDDLDGFLIIDLTQNSTQITSQVNHATHSVFYFLTQDDALRNLNAITAPIATSNDTTYFVRLASNDLGCTSISSFNVIIKELPLPPLSDYYVICDAFIDIDASTGNAGESYLWSTGETTPVIRISTRGDYFVTLTSSSGCVSSQTRFLVEQSSTAAIDFIATVHFSDPNSITVVVNGIGNYLYILDNGTPQRSNVFNNVTRGYHDVQVIDIYGCDPTPPQRVLIIDYPKFFTPNNDSFNDFWQVDDIQTFNRADFYVFDRHGKLLKSFDGSSQGWDGTYNGNPMPSSDYWFTIKIKDTRGDFNVKGHFALKR